MQVNPERNCTQHGQMNTSTTDGGCHIVYYNWENGMVTLSFDNAIITNSFTTSTEKCVAELIGAEPLYTTWFVMNSNGIAIPCRFETNGKVYMCNYTGQDLSNVNFYGEVSYARANPI